MKAIRNRRSVYAALCAVGVLLLALFIALYMTTPALICGGLCVIPMILLYRQSRLLSAATLICDNRILTVPSYVVTAGKKPSQRRTEETVISTFGLLLGSKVYRWGCEGVYGVRLQAVRLDREQISLCFGDDDETVSVEMSHGMTDKESIAEVRQKLWHETGIRARVDYR